MLKAGSEASTSSYNTVISMMLNTGGEADTIRYNTVIKACMCVHSALDVHDVEIRW